MVENEKVIVENDEMIAENNKVMVESDIVMVENNETIAANDIVMVETDNMVDSIDISQLIKYNVKINYVKRLKVSRHKLYLNIYISNDNFDQHKFALTQMQFNFVQHLISKMKSCAQTYPPLCRVNNISCVIAKLGI